MAVRTMTDPAQRRRGGARGPAAAFSAAAAAGIVWASTAWACQALPVVTTAVTPARTTSEATVTVSGSGWDPAAAVVLNLSADGTSPVRALPGATSGADGTFVASVRLAGVAPGVYYVTADQGGLHRATPVEVDGAGGSAVASPWPGLQGDAGGPGLGATRTGGHGSAIPVGLLGLGGGLVLLAGGWAAVAESRRRAHV